MCGCIIARPASESHKMRCPEGKFEECARYLRSKAFLAVEREKKKIQ